MIIISSVQFADEERNLEQFSKTFSKQYQDIFTNYTNNVNFIYRFNVSDFHIRTSSPSTLDYFINIWIIGINSGFNYSGSNSTTSRLTAYAAYRQFLPKFVTLTNFKN